MAVESTIGANEMKWTDSDGDVYTACQRAAVTETFVTYVKSSHYYLYSAFNNANCVKAALHQLDIKLDVLTSSLQYLDGEIVCPNSVILLWSDKISSLI